ncbi:hypothetical protein Nans01_40050 [Nocardiopsis ansamitocini]|uniref:Uncharacterized protein n=2 Tax=Nocardiopsis ansamitocini TaxID=1670832 RepID=A0A9W6UK80_9ACTN|nr:hypothetical protein Nans01_40050 [Nocardiopsis ansamitocini]
MRALSGHAMPAPLAVEALTAEGWDAADLDADLREQLRGEEKALVALAADCLAGHRFTPEYLQGLARALGGEDNVPPVEMLGGCLAEAASVCTHPVVRAAVVYLCCAGALAQQASSGAIVPEQATAEFAARGQEGRIALPWALASMALMRANHPPLIADHRTAAAFRGALVGAADQDRLVRLTGLFADLEIAALRGELSWAAERPAPETGGTALARAVYRRLLTHLRQRASSLSLVLRELDPAARVGVDSGDLGGDEPYRERMDSAAERALFARGGSSWWVCLNAETEGTTLRLLLTVQDVGGPATGVLAVTADARLESLNESQDVLDLASTDCVTLLSTDSADERWPAVADLTDEVVSRAVSHLTSVMA